MELEALLIGRIIERIMIVLVGGMCVYLGYRLFDRVRRRQGELELKGQAVSLKLRDVAPGIYFAIFGSLLLAFAVFTQLEVTTEGVKYLRSSQAAAARVIDQQFQAGQISAEQAYEELRALVAEERD